MASSVDVAYLTEVAGVLQKATFEIQVYFAALCTIVFYEWLVNLRKEIEYIWKADRTIVKTSYLIIRYSGLLHAVLDLHAFFGVWQAATCSRFVTWIPAVPIIGVVAAHTILLIQCHAVWDRNKLVLIGLAPLIVAETVIMAISSFTKIDAVPLLTSSGPCLPRAKSAFCIVYFAMPMLFDLTVTILTAIKVLRLRSADTGIGVGSALLNTIIQQSFQYFIFITAANLTNILYYAIDVSAPSSSLNGPLAIIATELFACRLTLSLRDVKKNAGNATFVNPEKKNRNFVKVVFFGDGQADNTELATLPPLVPSQRAFAA